MTQSTEQERALYECIACEHLYEQPDVICDCGNNPERKFNKWVASRAPVVPQELREAAQAVVERWDSPNWKDLPATGDYIARLRNALAAPPKPPKVTPALACNPSMQPKQELATNGAPVVPQGYEGGVMSGNRVSLMFDTQANAEAWFEQFCDSYDAAAPQLPQTDHIPDAGQMVAAPVQLPEPTAYLYHDAPTLEDYIANERAGIPINSACIGVKRMPHCRNETPLYTEQQVRQLLAAQEQSNVKT